MFMISRQDSAHLGLFQIWGSRNGQHNGHITRPSVCEGVPATCSSKSRLAAACSGAGGLSDGAAAGTQQQTGQGGGGQADQGRAVQ